MPFVSLNIHQKIKQNCNKKEQKEYMFRAKRYTSAANCTPTMLVMLA